MGPTPKSEARLRKSDLVSFFSSAKGRQLLDKVEKKHLSAKKAKTTTTTTAGAAAVHSGNGHSESLGTDGRDDCVRRQSSVAEHGASKEHHVATPPDTKDSNQLEQHHQLRGADPATPLPKSSRAKGSAIVAEEVVVQNG